MFLKTLGPAAGEGGPPQLSWPLIRTTDVPTSGSMEVKLNRERLPDIWISPLIERPGGAHCRRFHASLSRRERKDGRRQRIGILTSETLCSRFHKGRSEDIRTPSCRVRGDLSCYRNKQDYPLSLAL